MNKRIAPFLVTLAFTPCLAAKELYSFAPLIGQITPGVVNIQSSEPVRRDKALDLYETYMGGRPPSPGQATSLGSGFIWDRQGHIVTNYLVVKNVTKAEVLLGKGRSKYPASIIGVDAKTDLALLKISAGSKLHPLSLGSSQSLRLGDVVLAVGNPFGYSPLVSSGIVSAIGSLTGQAANDFLETDLSIHPGNRGGPLLDARGRVIGVNSLRDEARFRHRNLAIPIETVKRIVDEIKRFGKVKRAWLGTVVKPILSHDELAYAKDPAGVHGVLISNLIVGGPAHKAGLQIGDVILMLDGQKLFDLNQLESSLNEKKIGTKVKLTVYRRGKGQLEALATIEELPENQELPMDEGLF